MNEILEMKVDRLVLEYATKRAGSYDAFAGGRWDREIGLGMIDVKNQRSETPEEIVAGVESAFKFFRQDKITLNPDCGFVSGRPWPVATREIANSNHSGKTEAARILRREHG